ncbi:hypothetical protein JOE49_003743 [Paenibacillus sp. PvR133]|jgi:hypothetical protein|nr:hypothetical protein [Paenibacillus sp. PvR133]
MNVLCAGQELDPIAYNGQEHGTIADKMEAFYDENMGSISIVDESDKVISLVQLKESLLSAGPHLISP